MRLNQIKAVFKLYLCNKQLCPIFVIENNYTHVKSNTMRLPKRDWYNRTGDYYLQGSEHTCNYIKSVIAGNKYMLGLHNTSMLKQLREFREAGIIVNKSTVMRLQNGYFKTVYLNKLIYFAMYWNISLTELHGIGERVINGELK